MNSSNSESIIVTVKGQDGRNVRYKIKPHAPLSGIMNEYIERRGMEGHRLRFFYNGKRITKKQTAAKLGIGNGEQIDAMLDMHGGGCDVF